MKTWIANRTDEEIFYLWSMVTLTAGLVFGSILGAFFGVGAIIGVVPGVWIVVALEMARTRRGERRQYD